MARRLERRSVRRGKLQGGRRFAQGESEGVERGLVAGPLQLGVGEVVVPELQVVEGDAVDRWAGRAAAQPFVKAWRGWSAPSADRDVRRPETPPARFGLPMHG
jgi:hypothetical protein